MNVNLVMDFGKVVRVAGPASVEVISGEVLVAGASFTSGSRLVINRYRSYGIKALRRSELRVVLGDGGSLDEPQSGEEVIDSWLSLYDEIIKYGGDLRIIVIGPPESGKTSLTAFIANRLISSGRDVYVVDSDVGQADISVPCTIGVARPKEKFLWLRDLQPFMLRYVGCNSPQYCIHQFISAFQEVVHSFTRGGSDLVVNTDGWVYGYGALELKELMIKVLKPTHVLVLDEALYTYFKGVLRGSSTSVLLVPRPKAVKERNREDRRYLRHQSYLKVFSCARRVKLPIDALTLMGFYVLNGRYLSINDLADYIENLNEVRSGIIYSSILQGTLNVVFRRGLKINQSQLILKSKDLDLNVIYEGDEKGLLVGVLDRDLRDVSVGILDCIDYLERNIYVITPWSGDIGGLVIGKVRLGEGYEEVGRVVRCLV
ncbi:MAG: Clp1/GlmU family protein [Sulfolobales archaeon]|nr:Clp1/GlmU family protein [Sulfolobales archaeon]MCX8185783.1 Clp1/GlmU family protein [Sulfolobales archaeon]MDW7970121.1 Clp1/GlmU family protein [Sulfolobales archaeon]